MAVIPDKSAIAELAMFNTLVPQGHPGYLLRLMLSPEFHGKRANIHVDHDLDLGTLSNRDEVLLLDPAQAVLVIELGRRLEYLVLLVVRTQALIEKTYSAHADLSVPWDKWGRDAVAISVLNNNGRKLSTFVHGAQVMVVRTSILDLRGGYHVRTFDFSWRGRGSMPLRGATDGMGRMMLFEDGVGLRFEPDYSIGPWDVPQLSNDGNLIHLVSYISQPVRDEIVCLCHSKQKLSTGDKIIRVWKLR